MELLLDGVEVAAPDGRVLIGRTSGAFGRGVTALVGRNGAGKSTLLRAIVGLHPLRAGSIRLGPHDHREGRAAFLERAVYMPQGFTAYPELGAREFLVYFLRLRGVARRDARTRAGEWLAAVGLDAAADARTGTFSQGMLQRLGLAYALSAGAALLVLDEPFAGVDPEGRAALTDLLFAAARDRVALVCTHHVEEMVERGAAVARVGEGALALDAAAVP